jgi:hypothetical protein
MLTRVANVVVRAEGPGRSPDSDSVPGMRRHGVLRPMPDPRACERVARLFARYLDASPVQVARTARVQRAKRLLDATDLPMTDVAAQAGFRSLRRFNAVFAEVYRASPSEVRRRSRSMRGRRP